MAGTSGRDGQACAQARRPRPGWPARAALLVGCLALSATAFLASPAAAQSAPQVAPKPVPQPTPPAPQWAQPFAPAIGSRWRIVGEHTFSDTSGASPSEGRLTVRYDLAYTGREGAGYRVTLVLREATVDGANQGAQLTATALAPFRDLTVEGITNAAGLPLRVVNEAEVRAAAAAAGERLTAAFADKPQIAAIMRRTLSNLLDPKGAAAAAAWLDPLPLLASAQNTSLEPGAERRVESTLPSPFGGIIRSTTLMRLAPDARPEHFAFLATATPDPASLRETMLAATRLIAAGQPAVAGLNERNVKQALNHMSADIHMNREIDVEGGMARHMRFEQTIHLDMFDKRIMSTQTALVTVTPAP